MWNCDWWLLQYYVYLTYNRWLQYQIPAFFNICRLLQCINIIVQAKWEYQVNNMTESLPSLSLLIFRLDVGWRSDVGCYPVHISPAPCVTRCSHLGEIRFISEEKLQKIAIQKLTKIQSSTCKFYKGSAKIFIYKIRYYYCSMCCYFSSFSKSS